MDKNVKAIGIALVLAIVLIGASSVYKGVSGQYSSKSLGEIGGESGSGEEEPQAAPDFTVVDGEDAQIKLSDFEGKPVVLNFWASWCDPCKSEMPMFQKMYETYGEELQFVMINITDGSHETKESAMSYIQEQGYTFPVYYDVESDAAKAFSVHSLPTTYFIDADGNMRGYGLGTMEEEVFLQGLDMLGIAQKQQTN